MFDVALQLAKREMQSLLFSARFWLVLLGVAFLLGLVGPFGTYGEMPLAPRIAYWLAMAVLTYLVGALTVTLLSGLFTPEDRGNLPANFAYGLAAGVPVAAVAWSVNRLSEGFDSPAPFPTLLLYCCAISAIGSVIIAYFARQLSSPVASQVQAPAANQRPRILDRLSLEKRGALSHLTVQDHYVEVNTDRGKSLVLMRLADAIAETEGIEGIQVHRSHWAAKAAVKRSLRRDGKLYLELIGGELLPVSRSYLPAVKQAGLG